MTPPYRFGLLVSILMVGACGKTGQQPQKHFEAAVANSSTAPSLVRIELMRHGQAQTLCVYADDLIRALMAERGLQGQHGYEEAVSAAKANERHRFAFRQADAIRALNLSYDVPERRQACAIIAEGRPAFRDDITGEIREGCPLGGP